MLYSNTPTFVDFFNTVLEPRFFDVWTDVGQKYPPHNTFIQDGKLILEMAVAGFDKSRLDVSIDSGVLIIEGKPQERDEQFLHRGISNRAFIRKFDLGDKFKVVDVALNDGMLTITMEHVMPEYLRNRKLEIKTTPALEAAKSA